MSKHDAVKLVSVRASRSSFHHLLTAVFPMNHSLEPRSDFLGGVTVVSLSMGMVFMMRILLAH
jgi:hypothetical protein